MNVIVKTLKKKKQNQLSMFNSPTQPELFFVPPYLNFL